MNGDYKYKAAIIGVGNIGYGLSKYGMGFAVTHFETYMQNKNVSLEAVCDTNKEFRDERVRFYRDWREMMKKEQPQIVSIATPDETHHTIVKGVAAYSSVKALWCEKPIAVNLKQGREMVEICKKKNIKLLVNYTRRYDEFYHKIRDKREKLFGKVMAATCYYSGGITTNGSHMIDLFISLFGDCLMVTGREVNGEVSGLLEFEKCRAVSFVPVSAKNYRIFEINILGENGRLNIYGKPFNEYEYQYLAPQRSNKVNTQFISSSKEKFPLPRNLKRNYMSNALDDILNSLKKNREPISSGETALYSLEILSALTYSARKNGKIVSLPFQKVNTRIPQARGDLKT